MQHQLMEIDRNETEILLGRERGKGETLGANSIN